MLRKVVRVTLAVVIAVLVGTGTTLADAAKDCAELSGDAAIRACDEAIREDPRSAESHYNRGNEYRVKGDLDSALADYSKAIELDPKYRDAYLNRGNAYRAKGDLARAIADYAMAIELDPKDPDAYNKRCFPRAMSNGDLPLAFSDCDNAVRLSL